MGKEAELKKHVSKSLRDVQFWRFNFLLFYQVWRVCDFATIFRGLSIWQLTISGFPPFRPHFDTADSSLWTLLIHYSHAFWLFVLFVLLLTFAFVFFFFILRHFLYVDSRILDFSPRISISSRNFRQWISTVSHCIACPKITCRFFGVAFHHELFLIFLSLLFFSQIFLFDILSHLLIVLIIDNFSPFFFSNGARLSYRTSVRSRQRGRRSYRTVLLILTHSNTKSTIAFSVKIRLFDLSKSRIKSGVQLVLDIQRTFQSNIQKLKKHHEDQMKELSDKHQNELKKLTRSNGKLKSELADALEQYEILLEANAMLKQSKTALETLRGWKSSGKFCVFVFI